MEQSTNLFELQIDHQGSTFLREVAKWSKFLAIVGFVMTGLFLLVMIFAGSAISTLTTAQYGGTAAAGSSAMVMVMFTVILLIYFFPCFYLFKFATKMQVALKNNDQETLNVSFQNLKSCFKFMGILMIVVLSIYGLVFIFGLLAVAGGGRL
jgi:uncharacterized membrane protein YjgN (DUF898 family)